MADRGSDRERDDWARQVPERRRRGPYRDYGWEGGESVLPEFRDPSVHRAPWDDQEDQGRYRSRGGGSGRFERVYDWDQGRNLYPRAEGRDPDEFRPWGTRTGGDYYSPAARGYESGYSMEGAGHAEDWRRPGPYTGRGPRGYQRSNDRIREDVADRLTEAGQLDASNVEIRVENGEVTLTGSVDSRRAKRMAEDIAESVTGVRDVHNQLHISDQGQGSGLEPPRPQ